MNRAYRAVNGMALYDVSHQVSRNPYCWYIEHSHSCTLSHYVYVTKFNSRK